MLLNLLRNHELEAEYLLAQISALLIVFLLCLPMHEFAHAFAARKLGDDTAYLRGRYTLNPVKHLDPWGTLLMLVVGFGYAKPVPINPRKFKHMKRDVALVSAAGPLSNLVLAILFLLLFRFLLFFPFLFTNPAVQRYLSNFFSVIAFANISLFVFNLMPFPPLDGYRILDCFLPARASMFLHQNERKAQIILMVLLALGAFSGLFSSISGAVFELLLVVIGI